MLTNMTEVRWLNAKEIEGEKKRYSSMLTTLNNPDHATQCVREHVWHRYRKHQTELGRREAICCFNCLKIGHAASSFKDLPPLFPYFGENHHTDMYNKKILTPHLTPKQVLRMHTTNLTHEPFAPHAR